MESVSKILKEFFGLRVVSSAVVSMRLFVMFVTVCVEFAFLDSRDIKFKNLCFLRVEPDHIGR